MICEDWSASSEVEIMRPDEDTQIHYSDHMITSSLKELNLDTNKNICNILCMGVRTPIEKKIAGKYMGL